MITLIYGGSGSGKSAFAEDLVCKTKYSKRYYLATMAAYDKESEKRIERHRKLRFGKSFETLEYPTDIVKAIPMVDADSVVLLECMSNLVANEMFSSDVPVPFEQCAGKIFEDVKKLEECAGELVIVTNNIFEDGVSYDEGTKEYMRALGLVNSWLASNADSIYEVVVGIGIKL